VRAEVTDHESQTDERRDFEKEREGDFVPKIGIRE